MVHADESSSPTGGPRAPGPRAGRAPSEEEFEARGRRPGATGPELATVMAHVKVDLTDALAAPELPDVEVFARRLPAYASRRCAPSATRDAGRRPPAAPPDRHDHGPTTVVDGGRADRRRHSPSPGGRGGPGRRVRAYDVATWCSASTTWPTRSWRASRRCSRPTSPTGSTLARAVSSTASARWFGYPPVRAAAGGERSPRFRPLDRRRSAPRAALSLAGRGRGLRPHPGLVDAGAPVELLPAGPRRADASGCSTSSGITVPPSTEQGGVHPRDDARHRRRGRRRRRAVRRAVRATRARRAPHRRRRARRLPTADALATAARCATSWYARARLPSTCWPTPAPRSRRREDRALGAGQRLARRSRARHRARRDRRSRAGTTWRTVSVAVRRSGSMVR